jgi:hypothetical protein
MQDVHTLRFMGVGEPETFRCRITGAAPDPPPLPKIELQVEDHSTMEADEMRPSWVVGVNPRDPRTALEFTSSEAAARASAAAWSAFLGALLTAGAVDCPGHDRKVARLKVLGWLPRDPEFVPNPDGPGRVGVWRPNEDGLAALGHLLA